MNAMPCLSEAAETFLREPPVQRALRAIDLAAEIGERFLGKLFS
jgi:hypothetical protein